MGFLATWFHSRRRRVRGVSFVLAVVVALAGGVAVSAAAAARYRTRLAYTYERGLAELNEQLDAMQVSLTKGVYASTAAGANRLAMQLWQQAGAAKTCLTQLPAYGATLDNVYRFLSQVGEYALTLARQLQEGRPLTKEQLATLQALGKTARTLADGCGALSEDMNRQNGWEDRMQALDGPGDRAQTDSLFASLKHLDESMGDFPTLLYDGPFSDHLLQPEPLLIRDLAPVSEADARRTAAAVMGLQADALPKATAQAHGAMPCYVYTVQNATAAVTQRGGVVSYYEKERPVENAALTAEQCVQAAAGYLQGRKLGAFKDSYYAVSEGVCLVNFAFMQDDVVCYTDLIKVGVAMDTGEIVSYNAQGFIMNHTRRDLPAPANTAEEARAVLSPLLTVQKTAKAVIPLNSRKPRLCYEFLCTGANGDTLLVYVNADTLQEEELLLLLQTDAGTLTI